MAKPFDGYTEAQLRESAAFLRADPRTNLLVRSWVDHAIDALDECERLRAEVDRLQLALIEAQNPGINMDEVRRTRSGAEVPE